MPKPLPASRRAKRILVPAAVAAAENMRGGLAQARPSGFLIPGSEPSRNAITAQRVDSVMASSVSTPAAGHPSSRSACNRSTLGVERRLPPPILELSEAC